MIPHVVMTRDTDKGVSLQDRVKIANEAKVDCFVSVHCNGAAAASARGFESFIYTSVPSRTRQFREILHSRLADVFAEYCRPDRGKKSANFYVVRHTEMHAVLTENGFITNAEDAALLKQDVFLEDIAQAHADAILEFLSEIGGDSTCLDPGHGGPQPGAVGNGLQEKNVVLDLCLRIERILTRPLSDTLYRVQVGAFSKLDNAKSRRDVLANAGFDTYLVQDPTDKLYKVQVGAFSERRRAESKAARVSSATKLQTYITTQAGNPVANIPERVVSVKASSKVRVRKGAKTYTGGNLASFVYNNVYDVIQINGERVVIGSDGQVTAAVNIKDLYLA